MQEPLEENSVEEMQNVVLGIFTISLMLGGTYLVGSWVWALVS